MKTYISPLGFETTHIISFIVKHGIGKGDKIILLCPETSDSRTDNAIEVIKNLTAQIDSTIIVDIQQIDHHELDKMILFFMKLIRSANPSGVLNDKIMINLSGGPRDILIALTTACITLSESIWKISNFSDIDHELREIQLPYITRTLDKKALQILNDIDKHEPTTPIEVAKRINTSESTISRQCAKLSKMHAIKITPHGRNKQITITLSGKMLLMV
jgi:CRISPR-associated protein Csa3